ncbi:MAG: hypothetical protein J6A92_03490 [Lachnospiraceae bacterium]|nr:hypothetical protein [Lachnospiraceae bacterium]
MNYRFATCNDIDLLVSQRLSFIEISENNDNYSLLKDNCYLYFKNALANNTCDVVLAEDNMKCIGMTILRKIVEAAIAREYKIIMLNASEMGKPMYKKMGFKEIENGMILNMKSVKELK